ncbi:MAG: TonB family protein [Bacteroidia bacterium]
MAEIKRLIYIVDDEPLQAEILKDHLVKTHKCEIKVFGTGEDALAVIEKDKPFIVFLDYNLDSQVRNAMNGVEILKEIKRRLPTTECVMLSGQNKIEVANQAIEAGAFDYIKKGDDALEQAEKTVFNLNNLLLHPGWDDPTSLERAEMVFQNRNKNYGAYVIRTGYNKTTAQALIASLIGFAFLISLPVIIKLIGGDETKTVDKPVEVTVDLKEPPPLDKNEPPPPPPPPPPPTIETVKFTPPVVVDREIEDEEQPPPQEQLSETNVGVVTQEGDENATELPPEEPVADPDAGKVFTFVEEQAEFPGGEEARIAYLQKNIKYPALARENGIEGTVYLTFVVGPDGAIRDVKMLRGIGFGCDEEAIRVAKNMPSFKPAKQNGRAVNYQFNMPIKFTLK